MPIYLKLPGVDGNVTHKKYEKWIEIGHVGFSAANNIASTGLGAANTFQQAKETYASPLEIRRSCDIATVQIYEKIVKKVQALQKVDLTFISGSDNEILKIELSDVFITDQECSFQDGQAQERLSLTWYKIDMKYNSYGKDGKIVDTKSASFSRGEVVA